MHKLSSIRGERGSTKVVQWLRNGQSVEESPYIEADSNASLILFNPNKERVEIETITNQNSSSFIFRNSDEGYYNLFYLTESAVSDTLLVSCASRELLSHSCRNGHAKEQKFVPYQTFSETIPLQVVRERTKQDDLHYFVASGGYVTFRALYKGKPAKNVKMTLISQKDWKKVIYTDEDGLAAFQIIQDYFTDWNVFDVKKIHNYLLVAEKTIAESNEHESTVTSHTKYTTTYSEAYLPAKTNYLSMVWSLIVFLITVIVTSIGVYIYRHKRKVLKKHTYELP
jgi:hypothetical protein